MSTTFPSPGRHPDAAAPTGVHALPSDEALHFIAAYFAALADPLRLKIVRSLMGGERNVNALVGLTGARQSAVSRHLGRLASAGLVHRRRHGAHVNYSLADASTRDLCGHVCGLLEKRLIQQAAHVATR